MPQIVIFNDCFSANVGDGLIAHCLEFGLRSLSPGLDIRTLDLGGRTCPATPMPVASTGRDWLYRAWRAAPGFARRAREHHKVHRHFRGQVVEALRTADAVVIGGGQLITGSSNFFAQRLAVITAEAAALGVPVHVYGVGVSSPAGWGAEPRALLRAAFSQDRTLASISVRDTDSVAHWVSAFGGPQPALARDPALLAGQAFAAAIADARRARDRLEAGQVLQGTRSRRIGVGVIAPAVVAWLGKGCDPVTPSCDYFLELVSAIAGGGCRPVLFTNGSPEDETFLAEVLRFIAARAPDLRATVSIVPRPFNAEDLVAAIAPLDGVVAHRLHANILAFALNVPQLGLDWDPKLRGFLASVGRLSWLAHGSLSAEDTARQAIAAVEVGVDRSDQARAVGEAWSAIGRLAGRLDSAARRQAG